LPWRLSTTGTAGVPFWISLVVLALVAIILWRYTRSRNLMDVAQDDFVQPKAVRDKFLIALAVLSVLLFAVTHSFSKFWRLRAG
jgi:heme/copper-type cytochrome/quinol oxidase subunit 2